MGVKQCALLLLLATPAWASAAPLEFTRSIVLARSHNAALRAARSNLAAAEERAAAAHSGFLPQISGDVSYADRSGGSDPLIGARSDYSTSLTVTQNLFAGFEDQARVEREAANVDIARAALASAKAQLSRDLKVAFAGLLYAQENVALTRDILHRLEGNLRLVELRFEGGRENKGSFLLSQASVAQGRFERLQAEQALTSAQAALAAAVGQPLPQVRAVGGVPLQPPPPPPDYPGLMRDAPEVRDAAARERAAAADVRLARAGFYPSVNVSGSIGRDGNTFFPNEGNRVLSANVSIPLYSGGRDYYGERAALAALDAAKANREDVERQLLVRLQQSYAAFVGSVEQLNVAHEFVTAAETRAIIARARYQNGLVSFEEWDRIENDLIQRRKALLASRRDRVGAEAAWEQARGQGSVP